MIALGLDIDIIGVNQFFAGFMIIQFSFFNRLGIIFQLFVVVGMSAFIDFAVFTI